LKSTTQRETLFSSEHLTLLSLDHLYTFRTALQAYARTKAFHRLEDAVDELRRLFLANGRQALRKSALLAAYRWLDPVSDAALADVCRMYERAYGGIERESGVENDVDPVPAWPLAESSRDSDDMEQSLAKRMGMSLPGDGGVGDSDRPREEPNSRTETPILDLTDAMDKEILLSTADLSLEDQLELGEIEDWYREMQSQSDASAVEIHPLRSHPAAAATAVVVIPPPPSSPPPPPPTTATFKDRPWRRHEELSVEELRRTTPKLRPAPPGRSLALKLQTTFDKPLCSSRNQLSTKHLQPQAGKSEQGQEDEDEEELTARPRSAIKSFANVRWTATSNGISIDEVVHGDGGRQLHHDDSDVSHRGSHLLHPQESEDERIGPMTPNGYDDISPITRGEWGFLMFGKGKTAKVEMC
jgi:hypothetical protein